MMIAAEAANMKVGGGGNQYTAHSLNLENATSVADAAKRVGVSVAGTSMAKKVNPTITNPDIKL